jgi:hypothetical protein
MSDRPAAWPHSLPPSRSSPPPSRLDTLPIRAPSVGGHRGSLSIGVPCERLAQVHEKNEVTDSSVWSAILLLSIVSPNTLIAAFSSFRLRQSILKISRTIAAFSSPPLRLAEAPALSRLALVKLSRELGMSCSQAVDSSHFSPAASMTYTIWRRRRAIEDGPRGGQGTREASLSLQSIATHLLRLLLPLPLRAV